MNFKKALFKIVSVFIVIYFMFFTHTSCEKENNNDKVDTSLNMKIYSIFKEWYLWNDEIPTVNPVWYDTPEELVTVLRNPQFDKWSYISDAATSSQYFEEGKYVGHGFSRKWDMDGNLRISFVYPGSPMFEAGVRRGWILKKINGYNVNYLLVNNKFEEVLGEDKSGVENAFEFDNSTGQVQALRVKKDTIQMQSISNVQYFDTKAGKTAYFLIQQFTRPTVDEIKLVGQELSSQGVKNLIVDLRYNGGGSVDAAVKVANSFAPYSCDGQTFVSLEYRKGKEQYNVTKVIQSVDRYIGVEKLLFITSGATASASELIINGFKPFLDIKLIGEKTHGKPVGMQGFEIQDKVLYPICFRSLNANGESDFFQGINVDKEQIDNLALELGNPEEACLNDALFYLNNGFFNSTSIVKKAETNKNAQEKISYFRTLLNAY